MAIEEWKYNAKVKRFVQPFANKRILDIGMGQGPWGAALVHAGIHYYVGIDPAVCPPVAAETRDPRFPRRGALRQCYKAYPNATSRDDPSIVSCTGGTAKYRTFDVTGVEMMQAFRGQLLLLPGTFESLATKTTSSSSSTGVPLSRISFDYIMLNMVTEHLEDIQSVLKGLVETIWNTNDDGDGSCSPTAEVWIDHHNYYGLNGHHGYPTNFDEAEHGPPELQELADWNHVVLGTNASQATNPSLNRIRPGDLQFVLQTYLDCYSCSRGLVDPEELKRMSNTTRTILLERGFDPVEWSTHQITFKCRRRRSKQQPIDDSVLRNLKLHHPPMDGSYQPQPFQCN